MSHSETFFRRWSRLRGRPSAPVVTLPQPPAEVEPPLDGMMSHGVSREVRHQVLRELIESGHYHETDGLDAYAGDYSRPEWLLPGMLKDIDHARGLLDPDSASTKTAENGEVQAYRAALAVAARYPVAAPVPAVSYRSLGRVLVVGEEERVRESMAALVEMQPVHVPGLESLSGWLGAFDACDRTGTARYDLVLDLGREPWYTMHQPPQGYFAPRDAQALAMAVAEIKDAVGDFEKPKFFMYQQKLCAHSRSKLQGCDRCIGVCSAQAIAADNDVVRVEPYLCIGCGACAAVCPTGAMRYNYPSMAYQGRKLKAALQAYVAAGGKSPRILLHAEWHVVSTDKFLPLAVRHIATIGLDWLLGAIAAGVQQVLLLVQGDEAPQYVEALRELVVQGETILHGLGYAGAHFLLLDESHLAEATFDEMPQGPKMPASFDWFDDKRTTLQFSLEHLQHHAPRKVDELPLPPGTPFGTVMVDSEKCTLCTACVASCPTGALLDGAGQPSLNFIERHCVQCDLCGNACPEHAITLRTRLLLTPQAQQKVEVHRDVAFECICCGKVFGTRNMVLSMVQRLSGHAMFSAPQALDRLKMCGDCRVANVMEPHP